MITVLVGFLETVRELKLDPERSRDYLNLMAEQGKRMQRIIDFLEIQHIRRTPVGRYAEPAEVAGAFELCEQHESLGAQRSDFCLGQQVAHDRPGARPLPGSVMRASCSQRSTMALLASVQWRQPERLLGELGRGGRRAPIRRQSRGFVEHIGDVGVRRAHRQSEVTGAEERVVDDSRDTSVNALPLLA